MNASNDPLDSTIRLLRHDVSSYLITHSIRLNSIGKSECMYVLPPTICVTEIGLYLGYATLTKAGV